jgi:predicted nuclease of predicted toxin-antitoxin system
MKIYLDDDSAAPLLVRLLTRAGHDVVIPANVGLAGDEDPVHFMYAISNARALLTHNYKDFKLLHQLVLLAGGNHPGLLAVRRDNDPTRDLTPKQIVRALRNLIAAGVPIRDELHILNHWR